MDRIQILRELQIVHFALDARDAAALIRDREGELLFQHSTRVYYWAALAGRRKGLPL
jgi:hypothetical protein